jgi:hypothetical protein
MRSGLIFALLLPLLMAPVAMPVIFATQAHAQDAEREMPPMPRPRPDPDAPLPPDPSLVPGGSPQTPATEAISALTARPQSVSLSARITEDGSPITDGLVWRIFSTTPDADGEVELVSKSEDGTANVELVPGTYVVHLAYGRAQITDNLTVETGTTEKSFVLEAGALRLNAAVTGDVSIPVNLIKFDIFTAGDEASRMPVAEGLAPNDIVTLNAGTYHIVSHFGSVNALVRADLRVEPGQLTDATLYHRASQVSFKLVSEAGGEAIADVEWTVKDADGATVFTELGAFPATVLAEGDYLVLAKQGQTVFNREFQVQPGAAREIEVLTTVY